MDKALLLTTAVTIILAFIGYIFTYTNNLRLVQRAARLTRVNRQLSEFYGPMLAMTHATQVAWEAFSTEYHETYWADTPPTKKEWEVYRIWMRAVFIPINLRVYELILSKSDLLIESTMHESLLQFCAHVTAYQAMLKRWENNDFTQNASLVHHPREQLSNYLQKSFQELKEEQAKLLGKTKTMKANSLLR